MNTVPTAQADEYTPKPGDPVNTPGMTPPAEPQVWMAAARRSLDMHRLEAPGGASTVCGRSTRTGVRLAEAEAVGRYSACRCPRCWPAAPKCRECGRPASAGHKMDCTRGRQPAAPTRGQRIARELRQLADLLEAAGDDVPRPLVSLSCGMSTLRSADVADNRARVDRLAAQLGLPPAEVTTPAGNYYESKRKDMDLHVWAYCHLPEHTCARCGQDCGCGGGS